MDAKQVLARYIMKDAKNEIPRTKRILLSLDLKLLVVKSETIFGDYNITLEDFDNGTNFRRTVILIGFTRQRVFVDELFGPAKTKENSAFLVEGEDKCYWFA